MTRKLLIAQNLDPTTLMGGAPTAFSNLLPPPERTQFLGGLDKTGLAKDGSELSTRVWVASFAPGTTVLLGHVIKVHGSMNARAAVDKGRKVLDIDVIYRFVYAAEPPHAPADWMRIVGQINGYTEFIDWLDPGGALLPWVFYSPDIAGIRCGIGDGFIHPDYPGGPPDKVQPSGAPVDPYATASPASHGVACQATTGT